MVTKIRIEWPVACMFKKKMAIDCHGPRLIPNIPQYHDPIYFRYQLPLTTKNSVKLSKMVLLLCFFSFSKIRQKTCQLTVNCGVPDIVQDVRFVDNMIF